MELFKRTIMYIVKLKFKEDSGPRYSNSGFHEYVKDIRAADDVKIFATSLEKCKILFFDLATRVSWNDDSLEYLSIVKLNTYPPHNESEVIQYREFK